MANEGTLIQASFHFITQYGHVAVFTDFKETSSPFVTPLICSNAPVKFQKLVLEFPTIRWRRGTAPTKNEKFVSILIYIFTRGGSSLTRKLKKRKERVHTHTHTRYIIEEEKRRQTGGARIHPVVSWRSPLTEMRSQFRRLQTSSRLDVAWNVAGWSKEDVLRTRDIIHVCVIIPACVKMI